MISYSSTYAYASKLDETRLFRTAEEAKVHDQNVAIDRLTHRSGSDLARAFSDSESGKEIGEAIIHLAAAIEEKRQALWYAEYQKRESVKSTAEQPPVAEAAE
ncbi:MAG: hypothetical protein WDN46_07685 [Methylocella sp.]